MMGFLGWVKFFGLSATFGSFPAAVASAQPCGNVIHRLQKFAGHDSEIVVKRTPKKTHVDNKVDNNKSKLRSRCTSSRPARSQ
ncbi:hypothetical protein P280DRAFT_286851 [Massarina eburnea CBS 473.64]|uniref:Secreted protein n=1 Tax=Massarina eburnea CBS 473.64 TaxID=1395130 RepID=A0A6A6S574_9PLEO|nr:hypothetical protein P280DRAFT_286851 [Massarina eburnea CBS 473.64]